MDESNPELNYSGISTSIADFSRSHAIAGDVHRGATSGEYGLLHFNGYYALDGVPGGFFAVDANLYVTTQPRTETLSVDLLFCLDGKNCIKIPFSGSFDYNSRRLVQKWRGYEINLEFKRPVDGRSGPTAFVTGTIAYSFFGGPISISGSTYNNPIDEYLFKGKYYSIDSPGVPVAVANIWWDPSARGLSIEYDWGRGNGNLTAVTEFVYNFNMYYFILADSNHPLSPKNSPGLIMGCASNQGLACQNVDSSVQGKSRNLRTIPVRTLEPADTTAPNAQALAEFSGYYRILSISERAFVSISSQYRCVGGKIDRHQVVIAYSLDGVNSKSYYFDRTMTFDPSTRELTTPDLKLTFRRFPQDWDSFWLSDTQGMIGGRYGFGRNSFNPVPLSAFGPARMTSTDPQSGNLSVQVKSDTSIVYVDRGGRSRTLQDFIYAPLMYIVWDENSGTFLSLGTAGVKGNACIVMSRLLYEGLEGLGLEWQGIVYALPAASD
jgi:hypothetical protein